ncbi:MAG TPA: DCC1-like thiol-disulfide oxidoreductase family protein [Thermoanaerobaculia bacterium]|nr:DCC1-like thiol-disulfide oxidoreductase family protein [Thermoanaerobaculia bacterium]
METPAPPARQPRQTRQTRQLVLYDGTCGLCDRSVQLLLRLDRRGVLSYAPLQGTTAATLASAGRLPAGEVGRMDSLVFVRDAGSPGETVLLRSEAVLAALAAAGRYRWLAALLRAVPRPLRDGVYNFVARHRYAWFGRADACRLPPPEVRARFLD